MIRRLALVAFAVLLSACETTQVSHDFDASRDFAGYRSWGWKEPALQYRPDDPRIKSDLTEQRIRQAVGEQLDQHGLRPAVAGGKADVKVQAYLIVDNRQQQVSTNYGGAWGGPWHGGFWGGPAYTEIRSYEYRVATIQVDLFDGKDGKLVWRGSAEQPVNDRSTPAERSTAINQAVAKLMTAYPPS